MWWQDLLWGLWNGITGWIVLFGHIVGIFDNQPVYDPQRVGNWYDLGFLFGAGSPFLGTLGGNSTKNKRRRSDRIDA